MRQHPGDPALHSTHCSCWTAWHCLRLTACEWYCYGTFCGTGFFFFKEITICGIIFKKLVTVTSLYQFSDYCSFPNCMRMQVHRKNKMSLWTKNMMFCGRFEKALPADALSQITSSTNRSFMCQSLPPHEFTWSNFVSLRWYLQSVWKKRESCVTAVINIPKST